MAKKRIFVSFDFDRDKVLKDFIVGQARNGKIPVEIVDTSLKEAKPMAKWQQKAEAAIKRSQLVVVMVGQQTYRALGVLKEVEMARRNQIPIVQIIGRPDTKPKRVENAGRLYSWTRDNLEKLFG